MADSSFLTLLLLLLLFLHLSTLLLPISATTSKQIYIVHMNHNSKPETYTTHHEWYQSLTSTSDSILYTYTTAFHGFAAYLHPEEAQSLEKLDHVRNVFEGRVFSPKTTRTPQFLGLNSNFPLIDDDGVRNFDEIQRAAQDTIIGVLDTGIWPESKSFHDTGLPDIPKRWKGKCISTPDFNKNLCNKKLIGAYWFSEASNKVHSNKDIPSPRDYEGHGTHTASTAAGSPVRNATMFGYARGTARGIAANARLSIYKVCWSTGCHEADVLAGVERAIKDGVDVISYSVADDAEQMDPSKYYCSPFTIAALQATMHGIFVSCAAGNEGPKLFTVKNVAPWILTVGAGSIDRHFPAYAVLGNRKVLKGLSLYTGRRMGNKPIGLVYQNEKNSSSNFCAIRTRTSTTLNQSFHDTLKPDLVRGKVVICDIGGTTSAAEKGLAVQKAGGIGMLLVDSSVVKVLHDENHFFPTIVVGKKEGDVVKEYVKTNSDPTILFGFRGTVINSRPSPMVAPFSSRGPNPATIQILKPDVIAPGVNILAAWSGVVSPSTLKEDNRISEFIFQSGTSMSCPHASGVAALLKSAHPNWSTSAIKSAMMTTAYTIDNTNSIIRDSKSGSSTNPWLYGSGHIDPRKAFSPGLIYDISTEEYRDFFCFVTKLNYIGCPTNLTDPGELNYPSFSILFEKQKAVEYSRELTNVGAAMSTYEVSVTAPSAVTVTVEPRKLVFRKIGEKQKYKVTFTAKYKPDGEFGFGSISWRNDRHEVRSPIAFMWA